MITVHTGLTLAQCDTAIRHVSHLYDSNLAGSNDGQSGRYSGDFPTANINRQIWETFGEARLDPTIHVEIQTHATNPTTVTVSANRIGLFYFTESQDLRTDAENGVATTLKGTLDAMAARRVVPTVPAPPRPPTQSASAF